MAQLPWLFWVLNQNVRVFLYSDGVTKKYPWIWYGIDCNGLHNHFYHVDHYSAPPYRYHWVPVSDDITYVGYASAPIPFSLRQIPTMREILIQTPQHRTLSNQIMQKPLSALVIFVVVWFSWILSARHWIKRRLIDASLKLSFCWSICVRSKPWVSFFKSGIWSQICCLYDLGVSQMIYPDAHSVENFLHRSRQPYSGRSYVAGS